MDFPTCICPVSDLNRTTDIKRIVTGHTGPREYGEIEVDGRRARGSVGDEVSMTKRRQKVCAYEGGVSKTCAKGDRLYEKVIRVPIKGGK